MEVIGLVRAVWAKARLTCSRKRSIARDVIGCCDEDWMPVDLYVLVTVQVQVFVREDSLATLLVRLSCCGL